MISIVAAAFLAIAAAQEPAAPASRSLGNILNPKLSVIGTLLGAAGNGAPQQHALDFDEAELAFQAAVDPYAKADVFVGVKSERTELEEAYLTWVALPLGLQARTGKMRLDFGKFNRTHGQETPFADRPLAAAAFFGEEGLAGAGGEVSWLIPNPLDVYLNADVSVTRAPTVDEAPAFDRAMRRDLLFTGRLGTFVDLTERANVALGFSGGRGPSGATYSQVTTSSQTLFSDVFGVDFTMRWKDPSRAVYRSVIWQTEWYKASREMVSPANAAERQRVFPWGVFSYIEWQFARRWRAGLRGDYTKAMDNVGRKAGGLVWLTFDPSEFSRVSLQGRRVLHENMIAEYAGFLKLTFSIGPHGSHPF